MKKYMGLFVLVALASTSLLAVKAAPNDKQLARNGASGNQVQISQLDQRLSERIAEQQELLEMVEKLLNMNIQQKARDQSAHVLSGAAKPRVPAAPPAMAQAPAKPVAPPWWQAYKPQMTYLSGTDHYVVINGKMYTGGQAMGGGVLVSKVESDAVVLQLGSEHHTYFLKK